MRVQWVLEDAQRPGGVEAVVGLVHTDLAARGVQSSVSSWRPDAGAGAHDSTTLRWFRGKFHAAREREAAACEAARLIRRELTMHSDLVVLLDPGSLEVARHLVGCPRWGIQVHWSPDLILDPWKNVDQKSIPRVLRPVVRLRLHHVARRNRKLLSTAPFLVSITPSHTVMLGQVQSRVHEIPNPVNAGQVSGPRAAVGEEPVTLGYVGRLAYEKGPDVFIEALGLVPPQTRQHVLIAGSGPLEARLRSRIRELNLPGVEMLGWVPQPREVLDRIDVLVLPSRSEALGLVLVEALAAGCRIVATDAGSGVRDVLDQGRLGLLLRPGDPAALAAAIMAAVQDVRTATGPDPEAVARLVGDHRPDQVVDRWITFLHGQAI